MPQITYDGYILQDGLVVPLTSVIPAPVPVTGLKEIFDEYDDDEFLDTFSVQAFYFMARKSPDLEYGVTRLESTAIFGMRYAEPVPVEVMRTSVSQWVLHQPGGQIYSGGCRLTIFPTRHGSRQHFYDMLSDGDVFVIRDKLVREYDILAKGKREYIFSYDVRAVIAVLSVNLNNVPEFYQYGVDYTLQLGDNPAQTVNQNNIIYITDPYETSIGKSLSIVWINPAKQPYKGQKYTVEYLCSPNYVVWNDRAKIRAVLNNDLPKTVMCVKRPIFNQSLNPIESVPTQEKIMDHTKSTFDFEFGG